MDVPLIIGIKGIKILVSIYYTEKKQRWQDFRYSRSTVNVQ